MILTSNGCDICIGQALAEKKLCIAHLFRHNISCCWHFSLPHFCRSERQIFIVVDNGKIVRAGLSRLLGALSVSSFAGITFRLFIKPPCRRAVRGFRAAKADLTHLNLIGSAVVALLVLIFPGLQAAIDGDHAALVEILGDELRRLAPRHTGDKIRLTLPVCRVAAFASDVKGADLLAACGGAEFRGVGQAAHNCNRVQHRSALLRLLLGTRPAQDAPKLLLGAGGGLCRFHGAVLIRHRLKWFAAAGADKGLFLCGLLLRLVHTCGVSTFCRMILVRVGILGIVDAEQAVQGILAGVAAGCSRHLCSVHLGFLLRLSCVCLHGNAATIQRFQFCSGFDVVPPLKNLRFIGERKQQVMSLENRLHCFQNVLTGTIPVPAEGVHLPFRGLEFALHSGQSGVNACAFHYSSSS
nr:MAG TPA: hypothetical protein [Caudoviricetes sp.]